MAIFGSWGITSRALSLVALCIGLVAAGMTATAAPVRRITICDDSTTQTQGRCNHADIRVQGDAGDLFGFSVASGYLDGDRFADFAVGAPAAGRVYVFYGGIDRFQRGPNANPPTLSAANADLVLEVTGGDSDFGFSVGIGPRAGGSDLTNRLIVGAPGIDRAYVFDLGRTCDGGTNDGAACDPLASPSDCTGGTCDSRAGQIVFAPDQPPTGTVVLQGPAGSQTGYSVALAPLFSAPGTDDFLVGARLAANNGRAEAGAVYFAPAVASGAVNLQTNATVRRADGAEANEGFGEFLAAGRFLTAGLAEVAVGAVGTNAEEPGLDGIPGRVYLVDPGAIAAGAALDLAVAGATGLVGVLEGENNEDFFGFSMAAGDFDADGRDDLAVGAIYADRTTTDCATNETNAGATYFFPGTTLAGLNPDFSMPSSARDEALRIFRGFRRWDEMGFATAGGDVNDDGVVDLLLGARSADRDQTDPQEVNEGAVFVFNGGGTVSVFVDLPQIPQNLCLDCPDATCDQNPTGVNAVIFGGDFAGGSSDLAGYSMATGDVNQASRFDDVILTSLEHGRAYLVSVEASDATATVDGQATDTLRDIRDADDDGDGYLDNQEDCNRDGVIDDLAPDFETDPLVPNTDVGVGISAFVVPGGAPTGPIDPTPVTAVGCDNFVEIQVRVTNSSREVSIFNPSLVAPEPSTLYQYVDGSARITYPDGTIVSSSPGDPFPFNTAQDLGLPGPVAIPAGEAIIVSYRIGIVPTPGLSPVRERFDATVALPPIENEVNDDHCGGFTVAANDTFLDLNLDCPDLAVTKTVAPDAAPDEGEVITYTIQIQNRGRATANAVSLDDALPAGVSFVGAVASQGSYTPPTWTVGAIGQGAVATLDINASVDAGTSADTITNTTGTVQAQENQLTAQDKLDAVDITVNNDTDLHVAKTVDNAFPAEGETIRYTITVTNNGPARAQALSLDDSFPATLTPVAPPTLSQGSFAAGTWTIGDLDSGSAATLTVDATVNAGTAGSTITNTVTNVTLDQNDTDTTPDTLSVDLTVQNPVLTIVKSSTTTQVTSSGQVVPYSYALTNDGNVTLTSIALTDDNTDADPACGATTLAPAASTTCTAQHTVTQAEIDDGGSPTPGSGNLTNTVSATVDQAPLVLQGTLTLDIPIDQMPTINIVKSSTATSVGAVGEVVPYSYAVSNTGNVSLNNVDLVDDNTDAVPVCDWANSSDPQTPAKRLSPGETVTCAAQHTVTQADLDAGGNLSNTVTATSTQTPTVTGTLTVDIPVTQTIELDIVKASTTTSVNAAGQVIPYTYALTNNGNVTLTTIALTDDNTDAAPICSATTLAPTASTSCTAQHTVTQDEVDVGGNITNTVSAGADQAPLTVTGTLTVDIPIAQDAAINIVKSSTTTTVSAAGQIVPYSYAVSNTGNVSLNNVDLADDNTDAVPVCDWAGSSDPGTPAKRLSPAETVTCTAQHTVTQGEIDDDGSPTPGSGNLSNTVTATSTQTPTVTGTLTLDIPIVPNAELDIVKSSTTTSVTADGEVVPYSYALTNNGGVTLTGIALTDTNTDADPVCTATTLAPAASTTCTAQHTVLQAEVDAGGNLSNTVGATADQSPLNVTGTLTLDIPIAQTLELDIVKSSTTTSVTADGQVVPYAYALMNNGNVTLTGIALTDDNTDADPVCTATTLAPGAATGCTAQHTVLQAEIDAGGSLSNTVGATATEGALTLTGTLTLDIPIAQTLELDIIKSSTTTSVTADGQVVPYAYALMNNGNVTLTGIALTDDNTDADPVCTATTLAPGAATGCTAQHTVLQAEIDAGGNLSNTVGATADQSPLNVTGTLTLDIPIAQSLVLDILKASTTTEVTAAAQIVPYSYTLMNNGNVTLTGIALTDDNTDATPACTATTLAPGATTGCTAQHTVTAQEVTDNGSPTPGSGNLTNTVAASADQAPLTVTGTLTVDIPFNVPPLAPGISLEALGGDSVQWSPRPDAVAYHLYRGSMGLLSQSGVYTANPVESGSVDRFCGMTGTSHADPFVPAVGEAAFYLVTWDDGGGEASLGVDSDGYTRPNDNPCE